MTKFDRDRDLNQKIEEYSIYHDFIRELTNNDIGKVVLKVKPKYMNHHIYGSDFTETFGYLCILEGIAKSKCTQCNEERSNSIEYSCEKCFDVYYCSSACQERHYEFHKLKCNPNKSEVFKNGDKILMLQYFSIGLQRTYKVTATTYGWVLWDDIKSHCYTQIENNNLLKQAKLLQSYNAYMICRKCSNSFTASFVYEDLHGSYLLELNARGKRVINPVNTLCDTHICNRKIVWNEVRLLFIGFFKNQDNENCYIKLLPIEVICEIQKYLRNPYHELVSII